MRASLIAVSAALLVAGCAGVEPVGRNANRSDPAPVARSTPAPRTTVPATLPPPQRPAPQQQAAVTPPPTLTPPPAQVEAAPAAAPTTTPPRVNTRPRGDDIVVPGQVQRQVRPPQGDPRSVSERMEDIRAWDRCVIDAQGAAEGGDPMEAALDTPEDICRTQLGMADRTAIPSSRRRDR